MQLPLPSVKGTMPTVAAAVAGEVEAVPEELQPELAQVEEQPQLLLRWHPIIQMHTIHSEDR